MTVAFLLLLVSLVLVSTGSQCEVNKCWVCSQADGPAVSDVMFFLRKVTLPNFGLRSTLCTPAYPKVIQATGVPAYLQVLHFVWHCQPQHDPSAIDFESLMVLVSYPFSCYTGVTHHVNQSAAHPFEPLMSVGEFPLHQF